MPEQTRLHYQEELGNLEVRALEGIDMVVQSLDRTMEAVEHQDIELSQLVIADDDRIDGRYLEVHQEILTMLATQAPVATDLRLISALLHVMHSIERMGDQCVNISKVIPLTGHDAPVHAEMVERILRMGKQGRAMLSQAKKAFEGRDVELARDLVRQDDLIDNLNKECFQIAVQVGEDKDTREWAMTMMLVARALERIGDNAVDIGEQVAFVVTGLFREFEDASHPGQAPLPST
jgi:phosphate transport system protein